MLKIIYWKVSYREAIDKEYIDQDLLIAESDFKHLDREFKCLKNHNFKIIETNYEFGYAVIESKTKVGEDIYKKDLVPYLQFRPNQSKINI